MNLDSAAFVGDGQLIRALGERSTPVDCSQDRVLFCQGEEAAGLYIVHGGHVVLTMCDEEGDVVMNMAAEPGSLLGLPGVVGNCPYSLSAAARQGSEVSFVSRDEFSKLMLTEPGLAVLILRVLAAEVRSARIAACKN
ncbi:MAG TPA: Crp/Fnr family transcriptional regulator [Terracidiphilus sp.]|jgi:CRP-like cAMP-binding protein